MKVDLFGAAGSRHYERATQILLVDAGGDCSVVNGEDAATAPDDQLSDIFRVRNVFVLISTFRQGSSLRTIGQVGYVLATMDACPCGSPLLTGDALSLVKLRYK
jgi:hypothetical protein